MSKIDFNLTDGHLLIDGHPPELEAEMLQAIEVHGGLAVRVNLLRTKLDRTPPANVFLLDAKGKILWQIAEFIFAHSPQFYSNIWLDDSGNLMAGVPKGYDCHIDIKTGKILSSKFTK